MKKVERLTERVMGITQSVWRDKTIPCGKTDWCPKGDCVTANCDFAHIIERLAAYEDTKLSPEGVVRMKAENKRLNEKIKAESR